MGSDQGKLLKFYMVRIRNPQKWGLDGILAAVFWC